MGKLHKDTAMFMVQCLETEDITDEQLIKVSLVELHTVKPVLGDPQREH